MACTFMVQKNAVGFIWGNYIHRIHGRAVGQLRETHVYIFSGQHISKLYESMIPSKYIENL